MPKEKREFYSSYSYNSAILALQIKQGKLHENAEGLHDMLIEVLKVHNDPTYGDLVYRLAVIEQAEKLVRKVKRFR